MRVPNIVVQLRRISGNYSHAMEAVDHNIFGKTLQGEFAKQPRVFISHRRDDKKAARAIARYLDFVGLHYYFDEDNEDLGRLRTADTIPDIALVEAIDRGITHGTHLLAVLSSRTMGSWWVPYEIGSARSRNFPIAHLLLPGITSSMVPEFLRIFPQLWSAKDLFGWIKELVDWPGEPVLRQYEEWLSQEAGGPFGELGPSEETVSWWYSKAEEENTRRMLILDEAFRSSVSA